MTVHISLRGPKAERFEDVKDAMVEELGYEPSNPELVGMLMGNFDARKRESGQTLPTPPSR